MELKFFNKNKQEYQQIDMTHEEYLDKIDDGSHLLYQEKIGKDVLTIKIPLGTWDIMDALVPKILKYTPGDIVEIGMGESSQDRKSVV